MTQIDVIGMVYCEASLWEILFFSRNFGMVRKKFDMSIRKTHTKPFGIRDSGFGIRAFINGKQVFYG